MCAYTHTRTPFVCVCRKREKEQQQETAGNYQTRWRGNKHDGGEIRETQNVSTTKRKIVSTMKKKHELNTSGARRQITELFLKVACNSSFACKSRQKN